MNLLAFETATEACSVAIWANGEVRERFEVAPRRHAELALPWAEGLLAEAGLARSQLDAIAVGRGPGAFTGVRLAISLAQGIALALDRPIVAVSTLRALAAQAREEGAVLAAIDARMGEIYAGAFWREGDAVVATSAESVGDPARMPLPGGTRWQGVGTGFAAGEGALQQRLGEHLRSVAPNALPHAADLVRIAVQMSARGEALAPERVEPAYLRNQVALTLVEQANLRELRSRENSRS